MEKEKVLRNKEVLNYEAPSMEKHQPIKTIQGTGETNCYYYYNYYYRTTYYTCYYYYYYY